MPPVILKRSPHASPQVTDADIAYNAMPWFHSNALYHAVLPVIVSGDR